MADLLGLTSISFISIVTFFIAIKYKDITKIIIIGLVIRIFLIFLGHYIITLPDSTADMETFEHEAWLISQNGFFDVLNNFEGPSSRFISWIISIPYSLFGRSMMMAQSLSLFLGICCIVLGWKLAYNIWDKYAAKKVAWTIALFPSLILYSVLVMREVYVSFFLLIALIGLSNWFKKANLKWFFIAIIGFVGGIFFHGTVLIDLIIFILAVSISSLKKIFKSLIYLRISLKALGLLLLFFIILKLYVSNKIVVPYLGNFKSSTNLERILKQTDISTRGNASWPEWTKINSNIELIYKVPIRGLYFIFSPFPWDIKDLKHLIGMFDSFLYMYLSVLILRNIKEIWKDKSLRIIFLILLSFITVFGFGVGNFGTGIRHRSKFVVIFILLAAPLIKKLIFIKRIKNIKSANS